MEKEHEWSDWLSARNLTTKGIPLGYKSYRYCHRCLKCEWSKTQEPTRVGVYAR